MKKILLIFIALLILPIVYSEPNLGYEITPTFNKNFGLFLTTGSSVNYEIKIINSGDRNLTDLIVFYELKDPRKESYGKHFFKVLRLNINKSDSFKQDVGYHLSEAGDYTLHLEAVYDNNIHIPIRGVDDPNIVRHNFIVSEYSPELIFSLFALFISFLAFYFAHWKSGNLITPTPTFYRIPILRDENKLVIELPLTFVNDGAKPKSVDFLAVKLEKKGAKYVFKPENDYDEFIYDDHKTKNRVHKPFHQFVVNSKTSVHKNILFVDDKIRKKFENGKYTFILQALSDNVDYWETIKTFEADFKQSHYFQRISTLEKKIEKLRFDIKDAIALRVIKSKNYLLTKFKDSYIIFKKILKKYGGDKL